jgi:hypothetical protein
VKVLQGLPESHQKTATYRSLRSLQWQRLTQ